MTGSKIEPKLGALRKAATDVLQASMAARTEVLQQVDELAEQVRKLQAHPMQAPAPAENGRRRKKLKAVKRELKAARGPRKKTRRKK